MKMLKLMMVLVVAWNLADYFFMRKEKSAYIELGKVYEGFNMKKEYEQIAKTEVMGNRNRVDSMELELKQMSLRIAEIDSVKNRNLYRKSVSDFFARREKYVEIKKSLEYRYAENLKSYEEKIWNQINHYSKSFGADASYDYVFGVAGNGTLMYSREENNATDEFIAYINKKYKGE